MTWLKTGIGVLVLTVLVGAMAGAALWVLTAFVSGPTRTPTSPQAVAGLLLLIAGWAAVVWWYRMSGRRRGVAITCTLLLPIALLAGFFTTAIRATTTAPQYNAGAVVLQDGSVLVVGGDDGLQLPDMKPHVRSTAMLFHPATETWTSTAALPIPLERSAAVLLQNGDVLVLGGSSGPFAGYPSAASFLYHPRTGTWHRTGRMHLAREARPDIGIGLHAILLPSGKVLAFGGVAGGLPQAATAEIYDPGSGNWSFTASIPCQHARSFGVTAAMLLPSGRVFILCNAYGATEYSEEFDPGTGTWRVLGKGHTAIYSSTTTLLGNGTILVAGGSSDRFGNKPLSSAENYNPSTHTWFGAGHMQRAVTGRSAVRLSDGDVLLTGGYAIVNTGPGSIGAESVSSSELYHPRTRTWSVTGNTRDILAVPPLLALRDGRALAPGGSSSEVYDPHSGSWSTVPNVALNW